MRAFAAPGAGGEIRFHDLPGQDRPLVFVHGLGCASSSDYPQVATAPALTGRRALLVDLLGFGFSDRPEAFSYGIDAHSEAIAALIGAVVEGPVDLFGHSAGGAVAIVAARLLGDRVAHLVLSEPNLDPGGGTFSRKIAAYDQADYVAGGHVRLAEAARRGGNGIWAATMRAADPLATHRTAVSLVAGSSPSWREMLVGLKMPRTVLFGEQSLPDRDCDGLPGVGVATAIVPGVGHSMAWEAPAVLAEAIATATMT